MIRTSHILTLYPKIRSCDLTSGPLGSHNIWLTLYLRLYCKSNAPPIMTTDKAARSRELALRLSLPTPPLLKLEYVMNSFGQKGP